MALIKCPECGKEISDTSDVCIHCGYKLSNKEVEVTQKSILKEDAIIAQRLYLGLGGPIFGTVFFGLCIVAWFVCLCLLISTRFSPLLLVLFILFTILGPFIGPCIHSIILRRENASNKKPAILYKAETDEFELNNLNQEPFYVKRTSIVEIRSGIKAIFRYKDENGSIRSVYVSYVADHLYLKTIIYRYIEKY